MNWDQQFDFDDQPKQAKKKQPSARKKVAEDDFFGQQLNNKGMLPTINSRADSGKNNVDKNRSSKKFNPYAQKLKDKNSYDYGVDDFQQQQVPSIAISNKNIKDSGLKNNNSFKSKTSQKYEKDQQYYQEVFEDQNIKLSNKKISISNISNNQYKGKQNQKQDGGYGDDFEEDDGYGQDFQEAQQLPKKKKSILQPPKKIANTIATINKKSVSNNKLPPKATQDKQKNFNNFNKLTTQPNIHKTPLRRQQSRASIKSHKSNDYRNKSGISQTKVSSLFIPNKYMNIIDKNFPQIDAKKQDPQKVSKMNQKIRLMIKKLNDQLNEMINKNMLQMKAKRLQKQQTLQDRMKILQNQRKNNQSAIDRMQYQMGKLQGRQGQLKQQQFYLMIQKNIEEVKNKSKEVQKQIIRLKQEVSNGGKKLSRKQTQKKYAQQLHHLNINLIQIKKDDQKGEQKLKRLDQKMQQLTKKCSQIQDQLRNKLQQAKSKGIKLQSNEQRIKRYQQVKKKNQMAKNHIQRLQNLAKSKGQNLEHQNQQIRISLSNTQSEIKNIHSSIIFSQSQSAKVVQKAKQNPKVSPAMIQTLQSILKSLETHNQFDPAFQFQSIKPPSIASSKPMKNISHQKENSQKKVDKQKQKQKDSKSMIPSLPVKNKQNKGQQSNPQKPTLLKKKNNQNQQDLSLTDKKNQTYERVWKEDDEQKDKNQPSNNKINNQALITPIQQKKEEDKKKPFSLKKNRNTENKSINQVRPQTPVQKQKKQQIKQQKKEQQVKSNEQPTIAPKMMKFKRRNQNNDDNQQESKTIKEDIPQKKQQIKDPEKKVEDSQQPVFAPKRFNLRNRTNNAEKNEDYALSIVNKNQEPATKKDDQYKPNMNFKVEDNFKPASIRQQAPKNNKIQSKINIGVQNEEDDAKPVFNLRLKDRKIAKPQQNNDDAGGYKPPGLNVDNNKNISNPYAPKQEINNPYNPNISQQQNKNPYNPYANNQEVAPRKRQGPLKKTKIESNQPKQKLNLFEQAQDLSGVNQFVNEPPKQSNAYKINNNNNNNNNNDSLNLNDMLGINKNNKGRDSMQDLLSGNNVNQRKEKKRPDDFFNDL